MDEREVTTHKSFPTQPHPHGTLFALGLNYADHASELEFKPPEEPLVFLKAPNTLTGDNQTSVRPNNIEYMHYEAELVVVIGKQARNVSEADAMDYVAGYTVCNDYAIRDYLENYYRPNLRVKSRDGLTPMLSTIVPKEAFPKWANLPMKERARLMRRLGDLIDQNVPEIAAMETADTGLPIHQTKNVLIPRASHNFEFFAEVCQQMNGKTYPVDDKMLNYTLVQPVGVCALVSPWNVPFMTATWKVAPCLALGNTAVLKMSELSPLTADSLGELALEADIPAGVLNVVQGYGATAGDALVRHHDVRAVSFTGGTATGRNIMKNAGLKKYSMELGGKSPVLIFEDADIERALDAALFTIFSINGERCTAGSRIFIQQSIYPEFVKRFAERANRLRVGDPNDPNTQVGALISQQHWEKVSGYIRLGIEEGATLLAGGPDKPSDLPAHLKGGNFLRPTVLADVDNRMRVAQEEIFGPVACLLPFKDEAEGLRLANDVEYGLASYIWTQDVSKVLRLARGIEAGMVFVNTQNVRDLRQPFGGVKASGTGREGGEYSFEVFAEMKNVCISMGDHPIPKWGV
ncbi:5-carboxymethyl-2-hydroxymuconate semialdehyde dehydrogenase [Shigella sonnei]|nr:5-carboxymethyl-2-hydroxymuconate semialdehyde dehydrogenase [Shigella sonnei]